MWIVKDWKGSEKGKWKGGEERRDCRKQFIAYMDTGGVRKWGGEGGDEKFGLVRSMGVELVHEAQKAGEG